MVRSAIDITPGERNAYDLWQKNLAEQRITYTALSGIIFTLFALFNLYRHKKESNVELRPFDLVLLGLASLRTGRLIAFDRVTEPYRLPFTQTVPDQTGAGLTVEPKGKGWRRAVGELISCPICVGTWIAAGLVYGLNIAPGVTRIFIAIMGAIGLGEILNDLTEAMSWLGQLAREKSGAYARARSQREWAFEARGDRSMSVFWK